MCWVYGDEADWREAAARFLGDGVAGGDRLLYVADKAEDALVEDLAGMPGRDELLSSGQLQVRSVDEMYERQAGRSDPEAQVAKLVALGHEAVSVGYRSLRLAADVTALAGTEPAVDEVAHYELCVDMVAAVSPWVVMCGYDVRRVGQAAATLLCFVHPVHRDLGDGAPASLHAAEAGQWCLRGEVDVAVRHALRSALTLLPGGGPQHIDVSHVDHMEVSGVRALAALAVMLAPAGGLVLHRPPDTLRWMLDRLGDVPGLEVRS